MVSVFAEEDRRIASAIPHSTGSRFQPTVMLHHYCLFYKNDKLHFGWIREVRNNRLIVVPIQGKEFGCSSKQTEYIWEGRTLNESKEAISYLAHEAGRAVREASHLDVPTMHELCEAGRGYTIDDLAEDFLGSRSDGWSKAALLLALKDHGILFQRKRFLYYARTREEIEKIEEQEKRRREKENLLVLEREWTDALLQGCLPDVTKGEEKLWKRFLNRMVDFVVRLGLSDEKEHFCSLFRCSLREPEVVERTAIECLNVAQVPISWGRVMLKRASVAIGFEEGEVASSEELVGNDIWETPFGLETRDHRDRSVFTVDNPETKDFDDALGWEERDEGTILRIYVADVASHISSGSPLFDSAAKRISSLYTVKGVLPMLPPVLSENVFSLIEGRDRAAVTFEVRMERDGAEKLSVYRSVINVERNLSYREVDRLIADGEGRWPNLWQFCQSLKDGRIENGCLDLDRTEVKLDISDPEHIAISAVREKTPAAVMIEELAIHTNYLAARFCREREVSALFRNQPPYGVHKGLEESEKLKLKDIDIQPAYIDLRADGHSALGLECYMQVTSPIRRFSDLVNQTILMSALTGRDSGFSNDELRLWAKTVEATQRERAQLERRLLDYWKMKYLAQNRDRTYRAQLVRYLRNGKALVNIVEVQLNTVARFDGLQEEEEISVRIESIRPEYNRIALRRSSCSASVSS